ncbi:LysR substrate-binding domain-containing protein [Paraburkholderia lycopersici]|uniref:DNA-binding transcriptional regulator, LysR family n=1 Tax=Paraburkholderia lycopersici TaxID=416944 RepID=A0A1G7AJH1_9BURK|nr:LysR substrate-binding domain-containing protein [Paraburkholderia lycopersici]SDE15058.1 DNA-binding transcriptional regulator, LysR family [Paraburkholderia lycopersici]
MPSTDLSLRQVEAFCSLMRWRSVTRAAQALGISQPAVSRLLADFETKIGLALFERRQGRLLPTAEAHALHDEVERAFSGFERVVQAAAQIRAQRRGVLRVAASADLCADFLPRVAAAFASEHEGVDLELLTGDAAEVAERVATQRCDLGFVTRAVAHPGARLECLGEWPLRCILPRGHRLSRKRVIHAEDCAGERFISFAAASEARIGIDRLFAECGVSRELGVEVVLAQSVVAMVEAGMGVALVDALTAQHATARVSVKRFMPTLPGALHVVRSAQRPATVLGDAFVRHAAAAVARLR